MVALLLGTFSSTKVTRGYSPALVKIAVCHNASLANLSAKMIASVNLNEFEDMI